MGPKRSKPVDAGVGLQRELSLPMLVLYGLGTTVGAGIYALAGEVAGQAAMKAPLSFLFSAVLAGLTAIGFAELAGRLPKAAGEAVFVDRAFGHRLVTGAVGVGVLVAGVVAAAAITNAFAGYVAELIDGPRWLLVLGLVVVLGGLALVGVKESVVAAGVLTVIEVAGLGVVIWAGRDSFGLLTSRADELLGPPTSFTGWGGIFGGAFLAFFAFLGFEDMAAVAEETRNPSVNLPRAVLITLAVTTVLYVTVAGVAVLKVDPQILAASDAPLALVYEMAGGNPDILAFIAALAMVNGALIQLVKIPRIVYGLTNLGLLPGWAGAVSPRTHTPVRATVIGALLVVLLAMNLDLEWLARVTSAVTMAIFISVNAALIAIKRLDGPTTTFQAPGWVPVVGIIAATALFTAELVRLVGIG